VRAIVRRARRRTIDEVLAGARRRIEPRPGPEQALEAQRNGALVVDLRSTDERVATGIVPGSIHIPRSVLEWRVDPDCAHRNPAVADVDLELILMCADGYSSTLAAASLRELGFHRATDLAGGFNAWRAAGLPVRPAPSPRPPGELPGMAPPEPMNDATLPVG
jgi:rhodanese-related sulfurtransferase